MLTTLQKRKFTAMFHLQDLDRNGFIEQTEYEQAVENLAALSGLTPHSPAYEALAASIAAHWDSLRAIADCDHDNRIGQEEFLRAVEAALDNAEAVRTFLAAWAGSYLALVERDEDGNICSTDWLANCRAYSQCEADMRLLAAYLDCADSGNPTQDELLRKLNDFVFGDHPPIGVHWRSRFR
jgi:hypothetical protein